MGITSVGYGEDGLTLIVELTTREGTNETTLTWNLENTSQ